MNAQEERHDELPDEYHVLNLAGVRFLIDLGTRRQIESFLAGRPHPYDAIVVDSISGEEITVLADAFNGLWSSTPATRAFERGMDRKWERELNQGGWG